MAKWAFYQKRKKYEIFKTKKNFRVVKKTPRKNRNKKLNANLAYMNNTYSNNFLFCV